MVASIGFFFQAEDGIRDGHVTGVQTCALPISPLASTSALPRTSMPRGRQGVTVARSSTTKATRGSARTSRSEERRVGKERRSRWSLQQQKKSTIGPTDTCKHAVVTVVSTRHVE